MANARILLAEDESIVAMDIQHRLESMGYQVTGWVTAGDQVIPEIKRSHPDLVLMDIRLKGAMDGIRAAQAIRQQCCLPVVYLTALANAEILRRAKTTVPSGFVHKPFSDVELHTAIELALYKFTEDHRRQENEQWLITILQNMSDGIVAVDAEGRVKFINTVAEKLTGWTNTMAYKKNVNEIVRTIGPARQRIRWDAKHGAFPSDKTLEPFRNSLMLLSKTDRMIPVDISVSPLHDALNRTGGMVLVVRDRTMESRAEAALEEERNLLRTLIDTFPDSIYVKDASSRFIIGNRAVAKRMGAKHPNELVGKTDFEYYPQALAEKFRVDEQRVLETNQPLNNQEEQSVDATGTSRWLLTTKVPFCNREGNVIGLVGTGRDITERKRQQAEQENIKNRLHEYQKQESINVLTAGIAHDFNNILMGIQGNVELAQMNLNSTQTVNGYLKTIKTFCQRAADLIRQLLNCVGKGSYQTVPVNLAEIIRDMLPLIQPLINHKTDMQLQLDDGMPMVNADATQIRQVIMNLIINASEALENKPGFIRVETGRLDIDSDSAEPNCRQSRLPAGNYVYIRVIDSGCGMNDEMRARIFEPFFTTKFMGRGLGMAIILGVIRKHNGDIRVESKPDEGTRVEIILPCRESKVSV